jgi:hypothetical protein
LRVVDHDQRRADAATIRPFVLHAADATGDSGYADDRSAGLRPRNRRQNDLFGRPADMRSLTAIELAAAAVGDAFQPVDGKADFREVFEQQVVAVEFRLD